MKFAKVSARVLAPLAGAALAAVTLVSPAAAAPEHWVPGEVQYANSRQVITPNYGTEGARIVARVDWEEGKGAVYGNLWDIKRGDGNDSRIEAGYSVLSGGAWKPVVRTLNSVKDTSDSGVHTNLHTDPRVKIKDLKIRACSVNSAGAYVWCGDWK
ncbi:hypothetical protein C9F11_34000 [Streptomyces sp. YIM 121038]|uniref:hypothetical protein n=1 Tax=Streptomyces sp. YIM 121038 TaxID=2136401 RepID=UPI001110D3C2|nr:hypothetical protein [Streptomyces sp. YIM 121038]QCX80383.1 hypothetical protein C9F11_34000 [Streptomyces sp. YIM 121038]